MRRILPALLALFMIVGCDVGGPPPPPPLPVTQLRIGFPPGGVVDTIEIRAVERLPLRTAELVAPDGAATPAASIDTDVSPRFATGQWAASNPWQNSLTGNDPAAVLALRTPQAGAALQSQEQLLATVSVADIPLPDPVAYRRDWANYRLRLTFGAPPGEVETREVPAPEPPPRS